jgi:hypothetical protein
VDSQLDPDRRRFAVHLQGAVPLKVDVPVATLTVPLDPVPSSRHVA